MKFYEQYPMMSPYIGKHYHASGAPSLLLIGESHYLPEDSKCDTTPDTWYSGNSSMLLDAELSYISTTQLIEESRANQFSNKAHSIWRHSLLEINQFGPGYDNFTRVADDIAFYNFFLRPAVKGKSLIISPKDVEMANEAFRVHYLALKPSAVVFLSILAHRHFHPSEPLSIPVIVTPHPSCAWWNRKAPSYGNKRGRDILADFIKTTSWQSALLNQPPGSPQ